MPIHLIAIDIDGTLLDSRWQLPAANRDAIVAATARGIEVALVTGRRFDFALPIANEIPCALTMIVNNGAVTKSKDGVTHARNLLPRATARRVLLDTTAWRSGAAVVFDRARENQVVWEFMDWDDPGRRSYFERNREFLAQVAPLESCLTEDPIQVMFTGPVAPLRELAALLPQLAYAGEFAMAVTEYEDRNFSLVDVMRAGCSKGAALAAWAARQRIPREDVMAIGDNLNDLEMLKFAGTPVVMANSVPALLSNGWHTTASHDNSGVAAAIQRFVL
jgi:Cof subfamily protein (haloacid dehalogenase superfamily)